jgi:hypothetical protein
MVEPLVASAASEFLSPLSVPFDILITCPDSGANTPGATAEPSTIKSPLFTRGAPVAVKFRILLLRKTVCYLYWLALLSEHVCVEIY